MSGPLCNLRVLDFTSVLMGPYCTLLLGDMGADIIKIENASGDSTRHIGPSRNKGMGSLFLNLNRNKRSIVLDLKSDEGRKALLKLVEESDVFIHSLRPQTIKKLGLAYEDVSFVNKQIIYCGMYGFSKEGPYGSKPAYDDIIQAASGIAAAQGEMNGRPQYLSSLIADKTAGLLGLSSILAALYYKEKTGIGQEIEVPMFESMVSFNMIEHMYGQTFSPPLGESFYSRATSPYRKPYQTTNGYVSVLIYNDKHWKSFFKVSGFDELGEDMRFKDLNARVEHIDFVYQTVEQIIATKTTEEWIRILEAADIPCMPVNSPEDLFTDVHLQETEFITDIIHPTEGKIKEVKFPVNFSNTPAGITRHAPQLGEHNEEVLKEAGYTDEEIKKIVQQKPLK